MKTIHKIINGDSRQMSELKDKSVHVIIINAHLLKEGLPEVDEEFKYKNKFLNLQ
jgi:hypothetical protein